MTEEQRKMYTNMNATYGAQAKQMTEEERNMVWDVIKMLKAKPCEDAISRASALNTLCHACSVHQNGGKCSKCDNYNAILGLPPVTPKQRWIPVSERLPEEKGKYLVSFRRGLLVDLEVDRVWFDGTNFIDVDAWCGDLDITGIVTAWMPLPEPYKEEANEYSRED